MRLALFGGTFDPIHKGHIEAAVSAADAFSIDRVLVVPSGTPPHKPGACRAAFEDRLRMVELACKADERLAASRLEEPRGGHGPHYTVDTVDRVREAVRFEPPLRFIIGADAFADIGTWRQAARVLAVVEFLVVARPGSPRARPEAPIAPRARFIECANPASASRVRHRAKIGGTLADLAPPAVCSYIWERGLYRA